LIGGWDEGGGRRNFDMGEWVANHFFVERFDQIALFEPFEYLGKAITPRSNEVDDWDNYRIQDADIAFVPELNRYVMTCNMMDTDGIRGGNFSGSGLVKKSTRVIGVFYSNRTLKGKRK
ncbi:MAG: hypothetical protein VXX29_01900, partial [Verrucomicrobiota bacterium]|nr:hypothetical protein [Verrucomicrobiota bacterium]